MTKYMFVVRVQVHCMIDCHAKSFPWLLALHGVIEKIMSAQAERTARTLLEFWQRECAKMAGMVSSKICSSALSSIPCSLLTDARTMWSIFLDHHCWLHRR